MRRGISIYAYDGGRGMTMPEYRLQGRRSPVTRPRGDVPMRLAARRRRRARSFCDVANRFAVASVDNVGGLRPWCPGRMLLPVGRMPPRQDVRRCGRTCSTYLFRMILCSGENGRFHETDDARRRATSDGTRTNVS